VAAELSVGFAAPGVYCSPPRASPTASAFVSVVKHLAVLCSFCGAALWPFFSVAWMEKFRVRMCRGIQWCLCACAGGQWSLGLCPNAILLLLSQVGQSLVE